MVSKPVLCLAGPGRRGEVCHPQPCPAGLAAHSLLGSGLEEFHVELQRTPVLLALLTFLAPHATVTLYWSFKIWVKTNFFLHLTGTDKGFYCQKQKEKKKTKHQNKGNQTEAEWTGTQHSQQKQRSGRPPCNRFLLLAWCGLEYVASPASLFRSSPGYLRPQVASCGCQLHPEALGCHLPLFPGADGEQLPVSEPCSFLEAPISRLNGQSSTADCPIPGELF